jgi:hypothetical protein
VIDQIAGPGARAFTRLDCSSYDQKKRENSMRTIVAAVLAMTASVAVADEIDDAHRLAISGRDSYWNCLAREYTRDGNKSLSEQDFTLRVASVCPSERQNFRVSLVSYLTMQFPNDDAGVHMTTANKAIALAEKDIVTAFTRRKAASK